MTVSLWYPEWNQFMQVVWFVQGLKCLSVSTPTRWRRMEIHLWWKHHTYDWTSSVCPLQRQRMTWQTVSYERIKLLISWGGVWTAACYFTHCKIFMCYSWLWDMQEMTTSDFCRVTFVVLVSINFRFHAGHELRSLGSRSAACSTHPPPRPPRSRGRQ